MITGIKLSITGGAGEILPEDRRQLSATATRSDGTTTDVSSSVAWQSSNTTVATVSATGELVAGNPGSVDVSASASGYSDSVHVEVAAPAAPRARLSIRIDGDACCILMDASSVLFDASQSTGYRLTYRLDFGDGDSAAAASARHVFRAKYSLNPTMPMVTVTDGYGRRSTASLPIPPFLTVAFNQWWHQIQPAGLDYWWFRPLLDNGSVSGQFRHGIGETIISTGSFTGTLRSDLSVSLRLTDGTAFEGRVRMAVIGEYNDVWIDLTVRGGVDDGKSFTFKALDLY